MKWFYTYLQLKDATTVLEKTNLFHMYIAHNYLCVVYGVDIFCMTDCHSDYNFPVQTSGYLANLALGKQQTWALLSLELISGAYPPPHPGSEPGISSWKACVIMTGVNRTYLPSRLCGIAGYCWGQHLNNLNPVLLIGLGWSWCCNNNTRLPVGDSGLKPRCDEIYAPLMSSSWSESQVWRSPSARLTG